MMTSHPPKQARIFFSCSKMQCHYGAAYLVHLAVKFLTCIFPLAMRAGTTAMHGTWGKTNHKVSHLTGSKPPRMTCKMICASKSHRVSRCFNFTNVLVFTLAQHFSHCQQSLETRLNSAKLL